MVEASNKQWSYALVQHPMWLIISEDSVCAERTPPWGCESIEEYVKRLNRCLDAVEKFHQIHINFDFSAVELEDIAERFPDLLARIKNLVSPGRISFVNGTYSQPHLHILSMESTIRQFETGVASIRDLLGYTVTCYACQEPGFSPQLPQVLQAMGYDTATTPDFPFGLHLESGRVQHWDKKWEWLAGDDILLWKGADGSTIPLWLKTSGEPDEKVLANELQHGCLPHTRLRADMPDMVEVSSEWVRNLERVCDFVKLDSTLADMVKSTPPHAIAQIEANYAYLEGVDAEELSRANNRAEAALLSLETLETFIGPLSSSFDFPKAWKTLLKAQHHDAFWTGAPELRAKSIASLNILTEQVRENTAILASQLAQKLPEPPAGCDPVLVLHPYLKQHRAPVTFDVDSSIRVIDNRHKKVPVQISIDPTGQHKATVLVSHDGSGYQTLFHQNGSNQAIPKARQITQSHVFVNRYYSAKVRPDGTVSNLRMTDGSICLKSDYKSAGNACKCSIGGKEITPLVKKCSLIRGQVFDLLETHMNLGPAKIISRLTFYHQLPWFAVETRIRFDNPTEIGDYFDDRTKLHYSWPVTSSDRIKYALGGCPTDAPMYRPFFVNPWLDIDRINGGTAICLMNAAKCWTDREGRLRFLVGWGHNGDHFHNRQGPLRDIMGPLNWGKPMDLRLRGEYVVEYSVLPHSSGTDTAEIADWAASLNFAPTAHNVPPGQGITPFKDTFFSLRTSGILPLSLRRITEDQAVVRLMEIEGRKHRLKAVCRKDWRMNELSNLDNDKVQSVAPNKIVELCMTRQA